jgi:hypothetical protein
MRAPGLKTPLHCFPIVAPRAGLDALTSRATTSARFALADFIHVAAGRQMAGGAVQSPVLETFTHGRLAKQGRPQPAVPR